MNEQQDLTRHPTLLEQIERGRKVLNDQPVPAGVFEPMVAHLAAQMITQQGPEEEFPPLTREDWWSIARCLIAPLAILVAIMMGLYKACSR
jgi:hypothetical protein